MQIEKLKSEIVTACLRMDRKGWVANHDGNISVRCEDGSYLVTPGGRPKSALKEEDLFLVDAMGRSKLDSQKSRKVFSEFGIHQAVYAVRSDVKAIVHAHPPHATAVGCANQEMLTTPMPEAVVSLGPGVPLVGLSLPLSEAFYSEFRALLPFYQAVMVAGNGVFAWGENVEQAFLRCELVEHLAQIFIQASLIGGPKALPKEAVHVLLKKRQDAGLALPPDPKRPDWFGTS